MPSWIVKSALQHVIGRLPYSYWWNALFQKYVTKGYYPTREIFNGKLQWCRKHLEHYHEFSSQPHTEFTALELGTGSWPIVPLGLYLCGASEIWSYDLVPLLRADTLKRTLELFCELRKDGSLERALPAIRQQRPPRLREALEETEKERPIRLLEKMNIHIRLGDAKNTMLPAQSIDLIFSTVTLEHIEKDALLALFKEFRRVASDGAVMSHFIGLADQYASFDPSITPYNFLKYADWQWRLFNNPIISQSRLRIADYREILEQTGWHIVREHNISGSRDDLASIRTATRFHRHTTDDLQVLFSWLAATPRVFEGTTHDTPASVVPDVFSSMEAAQN